MAYGQGQVDTLNDTAKRLLAEIVAEKTGTGRYPKDFRESPEGRKLCEDMDKLRTAIRTCLETSGAITTRADLDGFFNSVERKVSSTEGKLPGPAASTITKLEEIKDIVIGKLVSDGLLESIPDDEESDNQEADESELGNKARVAVNQHKTALMADADRSITPIVVAIQHYMRKDRMKFKTRKDVEKYFGSSIPFSSKFGTAGEKVWNALKEKALSAWDEAEKKQVQPMRRSTDREAPPAPAKEVASEIDPNRDVRDALALIRDVITERVRKELDAELSERRARMTSSIESEAAALRLRAQTDAFSSRREAEQFAGETKAAASVDAASIRREAETKAVEIKARILEEARQEAKRITDEATGNSIKTHTDLAAAKERLAKMIAGAEVLKGLL